MNKLVTVIILAMIFLPTVSAQLVNQACSSGEYCDGYLADNGQCFGTCRPQSQNPCSSPWYSLWDQGMCKFQTYVSNQAGLLNQKFSNAISDFISPNVNPKGNETLFQFSYSTSFSIVALLIILTAINYLFEYFKESSSIETLDKYHSQAFKFLIMMSVLFSSTFIVSLFLDTILELNRSILTSMVEGGNIAIGLGAVFAAGIGALILLWIASLGTGMILTVLIFLSFFIVMFMKAMLLDFLLAIVPWMIVLYFFTITEGYGRQLFKLLMAHLLISTVWIMIFAIAFDFPTQFDPLSYSYILSSALAPIAAAIINSVVYFKIVKFFGSYESAILSRAQPIHKIVERRHEIVRVIKERRAASVQKKLSRYV